MPLRAHGVSTMGFWFVRARTITSSNNVKKNVLFLTIGPPMLPVNWCVLFQFGADGFHPPVLESNCRLLVQVLASSPVFRANQTSGSVKLIGSRPGQQLHLSVAASHFRIHRRHDDAHFAD